MSTARLFVAVDPPAEVRRELTLWARSAARAAATTMRVLDAELLHATICFLGERPVEEVQAIVDELGECELTAVQLSLGAPLWLPPRLPRALAVELHDDDERLTRIHAEVASRLQLSETGHQRETRHGRFRPHVTVARMRPGSAPRERELPPTPSGSFAPAELVLYRSWLSPKGASYEPLAALPLR